MVYIYFIYFALKKIIIKQNIQKQKHKPDFSPYCPLHSLKKIILMAAFIKKFFIFG